MTVGCTFVAMAGVCVPRCRLLCAFTVGKMDPTLLRWCGAHQKGYLMLYRLEYRTSSKYIHTAVSLSATALLRGVCGIVTFCRWSLRLTLHRLAYYG